VAFIWAVRSGQYEDRYTPSVRILFDDESEAGSEKFDQAQVFMIILYSASLAM
jgi:nitrogen fixation-related uncharacterized protein